MRHMEFGSYLVRWRPPAILSLINGKAPVLEEEEPSESAVDQKVGS